jgi:predicted heme/steroid binding protein
MKKFVTILSLSFVFFLFACGETPTTEPPAETPESELIELTLSELAEFDGRDGRDAYVAVDGFIYDVTNSSRWQSGSHNGFQAGRDLTEFIDNESPHGRGVLSRMPRIGRLVEE